MSLLSHFCKRIRLMGPISISDFMMDATTDPKYGYYPQAASIGCKGDFITAPELTPLFGEMISAWSLYHWLQTKYGTDINFIELGPGRGTLMRDVVNTVGVIGPAFFAKNPKISANLVEISEKFIAEQEEMLCGSKSSSPITVEKIKAESCYLRRKGIHQTQFSWYSAFQHLPWDVPNVILANEFFDALPVRQFEKKEKGWVEILVDVNDDDKLGYTTYRTPHCIKFAAFHKTMRKPEFIPIGTQVEYSPITNFIAKEIAHRIAKCGGFALIIDYGDTDVDGLTFRAFKDHKQVNPLEDIGACDLTADVNFANIKRIAEGVQGITAYGPITQSSFLTLMGIGETFKQIYAITPEDKQDSIIHTHNFLCSPDQMGDRFKVMCIGRTSDVVPICFEDQPLRGVS